MGKLYRFLLCSALFSLCTSCGTISIFNGSDDTIVHGPVSPYVPNGCVIDAVNYEMVVHAKKALHPDLWSRILIVRYREMNETHQHAYCVFKSKRGFIYAYDRSGSWHIPGDSTDPKVIGRYLKAGFENAWYEEDHFSQS